MLVWGHTGNFPLVADRAAPPRLSVHHPFPADDVIDGPTPVMTAGWAAKRQRLMPEDIAAGQADEGDGSDDPAASSTKD